MDTKIIPLVKNKCGKLSGKNIYRPVAISNSLSKVFELILLDRCEEGEREVVACSPAAQEDVDAVDVREQLLMATSGRRRMWRGTSVPKVVCRVHVDAYPSLRLQRISCRNLWMTRYGI